MKQKHRPWFIRKSFLLTMIFSMVILICIPLLAVQLWLVQQSAYELQASNTEAYIGALRNNAHSYNTQLEMLDFNALKITSDKAVEKPLDPKANGYDLFLAAQVIKDYGVGLPSVEEIGFYYPGKDSFLMNGYQPSKDLFFDNIGAVDVQTQQDLIEFLHNLETLDVFFVRNEDTYGRFLIARPVYLESRTEFDGVVIYVLDPDVLIQTFQVNMPSGADLAVVSKEGRWLVYNTLFPAVVHEDESFATFLANEHQPYFELTYNQQRLDIYKYTDEKTGNVFLASVMQTDSRKQLTDYVNRMAMFIAGSMLLLVVLFSTTVYINYKPVKKLVSRHSASLGGSNLSELELLDSAFFARDAKISDQQSLLASFVLGDLIYGSAVEEELLDKQFDRQRLRYYAVITVSAPELSATQANAVAEHLRQNMEDTEVYTTSMPNRPHVLFILLAEKPIDMMMAKADMHHSLHDVSGCEAEVRMGVVVQNLRDLRKSYYSSFSEPVLVTESDDKVIAGDYPVKEAQTFVQNVCTGEKEKALQSLEKIEVMLGVRRIRPAYRQYYCYKLLTAFLMGVKDNQIPISEEDVDVLMTFRNPTRLYALLREATEKCCDAVASMQEIINARLQKQLFDYVNENLKNCELCLMSVADHMNMSIYAVSRLFKERTGVGFKEYVTSQRLEMGHRLLRTTDDSVVDISREVGFESPGYFSTAFRKKFGMTPLQARQGDKK
ncbi:MAG: helix-turn-helix transcriptional regulator [Ruminococcaceae bacterium]|nr:helix-turn-helix transcriptional regulator [Oscillospiraceae bacterium]